MKRRDFLKALALTGAAAIVKPGQAMDILTETVPTGTPGESADLVAVMGGEPEAMFRKGIAELGGMGRFVKKGQKVAVKPNIGWDKTPEQAANTNPKLVAEIVRQCLAAGASSVVVFDHTCNEWRRCYENSGIEAAVKSAGGSVVTGEDEKLYRTVSLPKAKRLKTTTIHQAILDSDVWINVPILKHHGGANLTISMKNLMGIVWDRRYFHDNDLQQCIADVCTLDKKPVLNVVDAYRVLKTNGPQGRSENDVVLSKAQFLSTDIVAVDTAAAKFFNQIREMPIDSVGHLANGEALQLGTTNIEKLNVKRIRL